LFKNFDTTKLKPAHRYFKHVVVVVVVVASNGSASKNYYSYSYGPIIQVLKKIQLYFL
jgi:hypothetical protein